MKRLRPQAQCHPDRLHAAHGLCQRCYHHRIYWSDPEKARTQDRIAYQGRAVKEREQARRHRAEHPEASRAASRRWKANNPDKVKVKTARWRKNNPEKAKAKHKRRRALKRGATISDFTAEQWHLLLERYHYCCFYCGNSPEEFHQEHIIPLSMGGNHTESNIVPACPRCNLQKGAKTLEAFLTAPIKRDLDEKSDDCVSHRIAD